MFLVTVILVKLHAISYIVAIYIAAICVKLLQFMYIAAICVKLLQFMYTAKKHFNRLLIAMVIC